MTTRVLVLTSGQAARVHIEHRRPDGRFERSEPQLIPADRYADFWVPDNGQLVIDEPVPEPAEASRSPSCPPERDAMDVTDGLDKRCPFFWWARSAELGEKHAGWVIWRLPRIDRTHFNGYAGFVRLPGSARADAEAEA